VLTGPRVTSTPRRVKGACGIQPPQHGRLVVRAGVVLLLALTLSAAFSACSLFSFGAPTSPPAALYYFEGQVVGDAPWSVIAVDRASGRLLWRHATKGFGESLLEPVAAGGVVYDVIYRVTPAVYHQNVLQALRASDGVLLWEHTVVGSIVANPVVVGDTVYLSLSDTSSPGQPGRVVALRASSGAALWQEQVGSLPSAVIPWGQLLIVSAGSQVIAFQAKDGARAWTFNGPQLNGGYGSTLSAPLVSGNVVYVEGDSVAADGSIQNSLIGLNVSTGAQLSNLPLSGQTSAPIVNGESIYLTTTTTLQNTNVSELLAINAGDGAVRWSYATTADFILSAPIVSNGNVFLAQAGIQDAASGAVLALRGSDGKPLWRTKVGALLVGDGVVPPLASAGVLCVSVSPSSPSSSPSSTLSPVIALNMSNGTVRWRKTTATVLNDGLAMDGVVYSFTYSAQYPAGEVYAVRMSDGVTLWHYHP